VHESILRRVREIEQDIYELSLKYKSNCKFDEQFKQQELNQYHEKTREGFTTGVENSIRLKFKTD
jgi:hypothetical protein